MKQFIVIAGILLGVVILFWIGVSIYDSKMDIEINPLAEEYMVKINPTFNTEVIEYVSERTESLQVSPKVMRELEKTLDKAKQKVDSENEIETSENN